MTNQDDIFGGSDECRTGGDLEFLRSATFDSPLPLELGGELSAVTVAYETYGELNAAKDNAVLICHALTGDSHVAQHTDGDEPGWWDCFVGPGKAVDTDRYFVICPNCLGGCRGTTGPGSLNPGTGESYGATFPEITFGDMVAVQKRLISHLGIARLRAVIGGSMGGQQAQIWGTDHTDSTAGVVLVATSPRLSSQSLAFDIVGRNAIQTDPNFTQDGDTKPATGLAIARMLGHITYLSSEAMNRKFEATRNLPRTVDTEFDTLFSVGSYLAYKGQKFTDRFDANSYCAITLAMDRFDMGSTVDQLAEQYRPSKTRWLVMSFSSDWLFPPSQSQMIVDALIRSEIPVSYCNVESDCGHDAFLLENNVAQYGGMTAGFLENLGPAITSDQRDESHDHTSIFHPARRLDYDQIINHIGDAKSVLDLGCGRGGLLSRLAKNPDLRLCGIERDEANVLECVRRGVDVTQGDLNKPLTSFSDDEFDCVVLSRTLQVIFDVKGLLEEMLRVGRRGIVSVPNFGYHKLQESFRETGRMPEGALLHHKWYDTPNIRVLTLKDFEAFCAEQAISIHTRVLLDSEQGGEVARDELADMAIYVLSREGNAS